MHQLQQIVAHQGGHAVVDGVVTVQPQGIGHFGHIAVTGIAVVVPGHVIEAAVFLVDGIRQADAGSDAVAQGHIGISVPVLRKGGHSQQHQHGGCQQQADNTFFHNEPPYMANSEKITFPEPSGSDVPDICGRRRWGGRRWPPGCRRQRQKPRRTAGPASAPSGSGCGSA